MQQGSRIGFCSINCQQNAPTMGAFSHVIEQACGWASGQGMD